MIHFDKLNALMDADPVKGAWISEGTGVYRYALWRIWDHTLPVLNICGLNPSTADARKDDPTIRREIYFAKRDGFGGIIKINLFAYRATNPAELLRADHPIGFHNEALHHAAAKSSSPMLCAWGANMGDRAYFTLAMFRSRGTDLRCLGLTRNGYPRHPLYVRGDQPMVKL